MPKDHPAYPPPTNELLNAIKIYTNHKIDTPFIVV
jgi:hypothetical protein